MQTIAYTRLSEAGDNHSLQEADIRQQAARDGKEISLVVRDDDRSAWADGVVREGFEDILQRCASGEVNTVYAWRPDRLCRQPRDLVRVEDAMLRQYVEFRFADGSKFEGGIGSAITYLKVISAREESSVKSERVKRKLRDNAEKGVQHAQACFGLNDPEVEGPLVREAMTRLLAGESINEVARDWNARGVRTLKGALWNSSKLGALLRRPALAGFSVHRGEIVGRGQWEPVVAESEWKRLQRLFEGRGGHVGTNNDGLVRGLIYCGRCDYPMTTKRQTPTQARGGVQKRMYVCFTRADRPACGATAGVMHHVDSAVEKRVLAFLSDPETRSALAGATTVAGDTEYRQLSRAVAEDEELLRELDDDRYQHRTLDRGSYLRLRKPIEERLRQNKDTLARFYQPSLHLPPPRTILAAWQDATVGQQREWARQVVNRVWLDRATKKTPRVFEENRVRIDWLI